MGQPLHRYIYDPVQLVVDPFGRLSWNDTYGGIRSLTPPYTGPAITINDAGKRIPGLYAAYYRSNNLYYTYQTLAADAKGSLFVAADPVLEFTGNYRGIPFAITNEPAGTLPGAVYVGPQAAAGS